MAYGLTSTGFLLPDFNTIQLEIEDGYRTLFNAAQISINVDDDPMSQIIGICTEREYEIWLQNSNIVDSFDPDNASGKQLGNLVALSGIRREGPTFSTCPVSITASATVGFTLNIGNLVANKNTGQLWESTQSVVVAAGTTETVTFRCVTVGRISASAGLLTEIKTPKGGWDSAINNVDATLGQDFESDSDLKDRRNKTKRVTSVESRLQDEVNGVTEAKVYQNDSNFVDAEGRPPKSIEAVVDGGSALDIATAVWDFKPLGIETFGNTSQNITISTGQLKTVYYSTVSDIDYWVHLQIEVGNEFNKGSKQKDTITVNSAIVGNDYGVIINGKTYSYTAVGGDTKAIIASNIYTAIANGIGGIAPGWIPITPYYVATQEYITIESLYKGNPVTLSRVGDVSISNVVSVSGDQRTVIDRVANGSDSYQSIGLDVYRDVIKSFAFDSSDEINLQLYGVTVYLNADSVAFIGPASGTSNLAINYAELATLDSYRVTVEVI